MEKQSKCILLVRVSTQKQDFDEQEKELYQLAIHEGYTDTNIIPICEKESGIRLSEEERHGLNRMKEVISNENITSVFAWEISRIARKKKIIFSITDYLIARGIQLIIKEPSLRLLNPDKSVNEGAETILTLYSQIAESEMRNKLARWKRTRIANSKSGIWNGGYKVRFGYSVDENNRYIINEEEARIIRLVYELYTTTQMGQTHLKRELLRRGYNITQNYLQRILSFRGYTGAYINSPYYETVTDISGRVKKVRKSGHDLRYPVIISEEIYQKAQEKKRTANLNAHKGHNYYFAKAILKCPLCGHSFLGYKNLGLYMCTARKHDNKDIEKCNSKVAININVLDTLLWDAAASEYIINRTKTSDENKEEYLKQITICDEIINSTSSKIEKMNNKKRRIAITFANGDIDEVDYQKGRESVEREISLINIDYLKAQEKKEQLEKLINISDTVSYIDILKGMAEEVYSYNELKEMSEIVHTFISNVDLNICDLKGKKTKHIIITSVSGNVYEYLAHYSCGGHHQYRYWKKHKQLVSIFDEWVEINPEILIQRVLGTSKKHPAVIPPVIKRSEKPYYPNGLTEVNNI